MLKHFQIALPRLILVTLALAGLPAAPVLAQAPLLSASPAPEAPLSIPAAARTCKQVSSCEEAVRLWCGGYRRADGDGDGIPCENVCSTRREVDAIRERIGC